MPISLFVSILLSFVLLLPLNASSLAGPDENPSVELDLLIKETVPNLEKAAKKQPFKPSSWNDSLSVTAFAAQKILTGASPSEIWPLLDEAREQFHDNTFAILLQAMVLDRTDKPERANAFLKEFLLKSRIYTEFEESFIKWFQFDKLRRSAYEILLKRGVPFKKEERFLRVRGPLEEFMRHLMHLPLQDQTMHVVFMFLLGGGALLFLLVSITNVLLAGPFAGSIPNLYIMIWFSYALWLTDLAVGLPFQWSRHVIVPAVLGSSLILFVFSGFLSLRAEKNQPLEEGFRRCPHCQAVIVALSIQCFKCHKPIEP